MVDADDRASPFETDDLQGGRGTPRALEPTAELVLEGTGREGWFPRHLDREVAGAGGTVSGRGR